MPESFVLLVGLSIVWIDDDTVTVRHGNRDRCRSTRLPISFGIVPDRGTESREISRESMPPLELVSEWGVC